MYILEKSTRKNKKYMITTPYGKIHFGDSRYQDYTMHRNDERKQNYIQRHKAREDWTDITTAGFWSYWLLWNRPTLSESIKDIEKTFNIKIKY